MSIVFRREKPFLGVDEDLLGLQATLTMSFREDENGHSRSLVTFCVVLSSE